jgi:5-methylcytosine-specific restriction enzyme A
MTITTTVLALLRERSHGRCEMCPAPATNTHHRRPRGMGGSKDPATNSPSNLVRLCGSGTTGCHGWIERERDAARDRGWLLHQAQNPATTPILIMGPSGPFVWVLLTPDGDYEPCCSCGTTPAADATAPAMAHLRVYHPRISRGSFVCRAALPVPIGTTAATVLPSAALLGVEPGTAVQVEVRHIGQPVSRALVNAVPDLDGERDVEGWLVDLRDQQAVERLRRLA